MYSHEPVSFDVINAKDTEELELLPELSTTSLSNVKTISQAPIHSHIWGSGAELEVTDWIPSCSGLPQHRSTNTRWGYAPRKGIGFGFICQCSSLTPFPPADMQTGLSRTAYAADERKFVCVEIIKLISKPAQWLLRHKRTLLVTFTENAPSYRSYEAAVIALVKRFKLRTGKISGRAGKEGLLAETGTGRSTS